MENYLKGLKVFIIVFIISFVISSLMSIFWPHQDYLSVSSDNASGINFVKENKIKFLPKRVIGTLWTDFYISKNGKYVYDFNDLGEEISYRNLDTKYVDEHKLLPKYSWWQSYGWLIIILLGLVLSFWGEDFWHLIFSILSEAD